MTSSQVQGRPRPHQRFFFMHIHKCAGSSLYKIFEEVFPDEVICKYIFDYQFKGASTSQLSNYSLFRGHIAMATLKKHFQNLEILTFLRAPASRLISAYFFWRALAPDYPDMSFFRKLTQISLDEFLTSDDPEILRATDNVQARVLGGGEYGPENSMRTQVFGPRTTDDKLVSRAKAAIDRMAFVGLVEEFPRAIRSLCQQYGWKCPDRTPWEKKGPSRPTVNISNAANDALIRKTRLDLELYQYALKTRSCGSHSEEYRAANNQVEATGVPPASHP